MAIDKTNPVGRFGCFKVLPLVFDEALSYYEVLCKLRNSLNEVIEQANALVNELGLTDAEIDELKEIVGEGSVDDRIYGAELSAKAYTDEVTELLDTRLDALEEGADVRINVLGTGTGLQENVIIYSGDITKGIRRLRIGSTPTDPSSTDLVSTDCHMYSFAPYSYGSNDYVIRFWHCQGPYTWKYITAVIVQSGSDWLVDASRSSVLVLNV